VAKVVQVENSAAGAFGRVVCQPLAGIDRNRQLLILMSPPDLLPRPAEEPPKVVGKKQGLPKMTPLNLPPLAPSTGQPKVQPPASPAGSPVAGVKAATPVAPPPAAVAPAPAANKGAAQ
jgi:rod shape-determining protein MreC